MTPEKEKAATLLLNIIYELETRTTIRNVLVAQARQAIEALLVADTTLPPNK